MTEIDLATLTAQDAYPLIGQAWVIPAGTFEGYDLPVTLVLTDVKTINPDLQQQGQRLSFSLYLQGGGDVSLEQGMYPFEQATLGRLTIFIVPIAQNATGFLYQYLSQKRCLNGRGF